LRLLLLLLLLLSLEHEPSGGRGTWHGCRHRVASSSGSNSALVDGARESGRPGSWKGRWP
jgi:hypothetical protein